jgi:hypothetical protein
MRLYLQLAWAADDQGVPYLLAMPLDAATGKRRGRVRRLYGWQRNLDRIWWLACQRGYPLYRRYGGRGLVLAR